MSEQGILLVLSGPSGAGKSTVIRKLMEARGNMEFSVSATTRSPRPGEVDGVDYYFVTREKFQEMVERGELLEHAEFVGNCYGTPRGPIEKKLAEGVTMVLDIEVQGAGQVKEKMPQALTVFLTPPSLEELERRLRGRGTESEATILSRLERAREEMELADRYDYTVINDDVDRAAQELGDILSAWNQGK